MYSNSPQSDTFIFLPHYWSASIIISKNTFIFNSLLKDFIKKNGGIFYYESKH